VPRRPRDEQKETHREGLGDRLMVSEFFAIIRREGMPREGEGFQQGHHCGSDRVSTLAHDLGQQAQARCAFG
jgi:hypothetical protein